MIKTYEVEIKKIYENIRKEEEFALKQRKEEIEKNLPQIMDIEKKIAQLCLNMSMTLLKDSSNSEKYLSELKEKITELRVQKTELMVGNNYNRDYLKLHYRCPKCGDTGFVGNQQCSCYKQKLVKIYYNNSELKDTLDSNNFDYFNFDYYSTQRSEGDPESPRKNMEKTVSKIQNYITNFESSSENLMFYGNSGTGKTFLSHCLAKELLDKGYLVVYRTAESLIQGLKDIRFNNNSELEELLMKCDLLIVDDLGTEQISDFSKMELFNLLNNKLLQNSKMLFSTNYTLEDLLKIYSERITSRLFGNFSLYKFYGEDIRIKMKYKK